MDEDIKEDLKFVSKNVQAVGRMISSKKTGIETLESLSGTLRMDADVLDKYVKIQKDRYTE